MRRLWSDVYNLRYALLGIILYFVAVHIVFGQFCPAVILFRFPCPGCGMTRALYLALTGRWTAAWELQPWVFGWIVLGFMFVVNRYVRNRKSVFLQGFLIVLLLGTIGIYVLRLLYGFPSEILGSLPYM